MQLKEFQKRTLEALTDYFRACVSLKNANVAFYQTTLSRYGMGVNYNPVKELPDLPYVCLRLPTGGGKTFVAAHAVGVAARELLHSDTPLALWLVPSNAIREQTFKALKDRKHPYHQALQSYGQDVTVLDINEALSVQPAQLNGVTVILSTMQAFRVEETEGRKVYEQNGSLMSHFSTLKPETLATLETHENGTPVYSLANVLKAYRPIVIVDEAHNARTDLSFATLSRFYPSCIIEFTATPDTEQQPSNVLHTVSAAELKAEGMIKLPIYLETNQDWKVAIAKSVAKRNELEAIARAERVESGEYIRPVVLLQAQPNYKTKSSITVDLVKECLLKDNQIPPEQVAIATGAENEIADVDLFATDCPIRYIITIQALREGWDFSFAYILCSVAELSSPTAVEQILGRILRLPYVTAKKHAELNRAYTYATSLKFAETANTLADALIKNGFQKQEVRDLIRSTSGQPPLMDYGPLFENEEQIETESPEVTEEFSVPVLAVRQGDFLGQFDESYFLDRPIELAKCDPYLSEEEFPKDAPEGFKAEIDINEAGKVSFTQNFIREVQAQSYLLSVDQGVTKESLAVWLDRSISHVDIPQRESLVFFTGMVERLLENNRWTLGELAREKYRLREAARKKIDEYRKAVHEEAYQEFLFETKNYELVVTPDRPFTYPEDYPYPAVNSFRAKEAGFKKHYYEWIGDLVRDPNKEEFICAQFLENHPKVKRWVRNLDGHVKSSFWLQTSTDKAYPDFVCELVDGRYLVVEYKGADRWSNDDSKEKRMIGQRYEELSNGKCLFIMPNGPDWNAILAKIG